MSCSPSAGARFAARCRFDELNELIGQHNEWYPIERDLPMDLRTRDYVLHQRALLPARAADGRVGAAPLSRLMNVS